MKTIKVILQALIMVSVLFVAQKGFALNEDLMFKEDANINRFVEQLLDEQRSQANQQHTNKKSSNIYFKQFVQNKEVPHEHIDTNS